MGKINDMIQRLCPDGVEYKRLGDVGIFYRGNGLQKKDFTSSGVGCIHYGQIYTHYKLFTDSTISFVTPELAKRLTKVHPGDLIITNTSENVEDVCMAVAWLGNEDIVTGGHASVFHHHENPKFLSYYFKTQDFFNQKIKYARGTKVIDVKVDDLAKIEIPIPPLEIQNVIVNVLDKFTALTAELEAELEARQKQYEYYRDNLLTFSKIANRGGYQVSDNQLLTWLNPYSKLSRLVRELCPNGVEWYKINDLGVFYSGLSGKSKEDFKNGNAKFISYINIYNNPSLNLNISDTVKINEGEKQNKIKKGDILFTGSSETPDECGMSSVVTADVNDDYYLNSFCFGLRLKDIEKFNLNFLKHLFRSWIIRKQIFNTASGVTRFNVSKKRFAEIEIPVPPMPVQEEIVRILDKFEKLTTDISEGLPAEIAARQKQYEYYRDRLLNFKRLEA